MRTGAQRKDLLPTVKKNFNARRTLHAAIDTIRAINQLRAGGAAAMAGNMGRGGAVGGGAGAGDKKEAGDATDAMEGVQGPGSVNAKEEDGANAKLRTTMDPRGNARGQTQEQIMEQQRRVHEATNAMWARR